MKKLLLILLLFPLFSLAQKIEKKSSGEVVELKDCVSNYCTVFITATITPSFIVSINEENQCYFVDQEGKRKKLNTNVELLNYMYDNDWVFITMLVQTNQYVFEKKKKKD